MKRAPLNIRRKLTLLSFGVIGTLVIALTLYFSSQNVELARSNLEKKAAVYAGLFSVELEPAVAFDDRQTAREVFEAASLDPDVQGLGLFAADGHSIGESGEVAAPSVVVKNTKITSRPGAISCLAPVVSREGARGTLVIELSVAAVGAAKARALYTGIGVGVSALVLGLFASWLIGGSFAFRVRRIQSAARAVADGELGVAPIIDSSNDEIGMLAKDFNTMAASLNDLVEQITTRAQEEKTRLDALVDLRTSELTSRNEDLRLVLDNVGQGFATVDSSGTLSRERSAILEKWFGSLGDEASVTDVVSRADAKAAEWICVGWDSLFDGVFPTDVAIGQLPATFRSSTSEYRIEYRPIGGGDVPEKILVVVSDITAEVAGQRATQAQRELASLFGHVMSDRIGVEEFYVEGAAIIASLREAGDTKPSAETKRRLHTLKGNAAVFGLERLSSACHDAETKIEENDALVLKIATAPILSIWNEIETALAPAFEGRTDVVEIEKSELTSAIQALRGGVSGSEMVDRLTDWSLEPMNKRLTRLAEQTRALAARLGKSNVDIRVVADYARLDAERCAGFWMSFVHVLRNAIDHGVDDADARASAGKSGCGIVTLRAVSKAHEVIIEVEDDGPGVDWLTLRRRAGELGLTATSDEDLLFAESVSSKSQVTELSGRGVGLGAAREACRAIGGRVDFASHAGHGTKFSFHIPTRPAARHSSAPRATRASNVRPLKSLPPLPR